MFGNNVVPDYENVCLLNYKIYHFCLINVWKRMITYMFMNFGRYWYHQCNGHLHIHIQVLVR